MIAFPVRCRHGESPVWDDTCSKLFMVDINLGCGLSVDSAGYVDRFLVGRALTSIFLTRSKRVGFCDLDSLCIEGGPQRYPVPIAYGTRLNEAKVDQYGRLWVASMALSESDPIGALFRIDRSGTCQQVLTGLTVGNGIDWTADHSRMYITDSGCGEIYRYDFRPETGYLSNRRVFAKVSMEFGKPDGLALDTEGGVWSAHFDGGRITRYHSTGEIDFILELPAKSPTSLCFGGSNYTELFVTTSTLGSSKDRPEDGSLLRIPTKFRGLPTYGFDDTLNLKSTNER